MRILILNRVSDRLARYTDGIDHDRHDVTYVATAEQMAGLPTGPRATRIERPGTADTTEEVLTAIAGRPAPNLVVALSEFDLMAAAEIREALDVPGDRPEDVLLVRDKLAMKAAVEEAGLAVPRFLPLEQALDNPNGITWSGRTVLKPRSGLASINVDTFDAPSQALDHVRQHGLPADTAPEAFEIEEFVEGPIIHIDGIAVGDKPVAIQASRYVGTCLGYAQGQPLGSVQIETTPALAEWVSNCLHAVRIGTNIFHLEAIQTPDGPVFLEVAGRFGGAGVVETFELATGIHMPSALLRCWTEGEQADLQMTTATDSAARYGWFVWPGHWLGNAGRVVHNEAGFRHDPIVTRWVQPDSSQHVAEHITYQETLVPLSGTIGPATTGQLKEYLHRQFTTIRITAAEY